MLNTLKMIEDWCKYRNEVVHALMNKNIDSLRSELCDKAIEGMELANRLDTYVRDMKKGNKVRKSASIRVEVTPIWYEKKFEDKIKEVDEALDAIYELFQLSKKIASIK